MGVRGIVCCVSVKVSSCAHGECGACRSSRTAFQDAGRSTCDGQGDRCRGGLGEAMILRRLRVLAYTCIFATTTHRGAASGDDDTAYDVYDAHSCGAGASWVCTSQQPVSAAACESAGACKVGAMPAGGLGALASEAVEGVGNLIAVAVSEKAPAVKKCSRGKRRRGGRCVKVAAKKAERRLRGTHGKRKRRGAVVGSAKRVRRSAGGGR